METIEELYTRSDYEFEQKLYESCRNGNTNFIEEFINSNIKKDYLFSSIIWKMLEDASIYKQNHIVKLILDTECLARNINREKAIKRCFTDACTVGDFDMVEHLLNNEKEDLDINSIASGCREAIRCNNINVLKYILNHDEAKPFLKYELMTSDLLQSSAEYGNVEAINYIISFQGLMQNEKSYFYEHTDKVLMFAVYHQHIEMVRFLVCEMDIEKTKEVASLLRDNPHKEINKIFQLKDLNKTLNSELSVDKTSIKRMKV